MRQLMHSMSKICTLQATSVCVYGHSSIAPSCCEDLLQQLFEQKALICQTRHVHISGDDEEKLKLNVALESVFTICKQQYLRQPDMTGAHFFDFVMK